MENYKYVGKSRLKKGGLVIKEENIGSLPESQLITFCKKKIIQKTNPKKNDS